MSIVNIIDKTLKESPIRSIASWGGLGYVGVHIFNNIVQPEEQKNAQIPAILGATAGYFAGPLMIDKVMEIIKKEGEENSFYSLLTKYSATLGGALLGGVAGKIAIDKFREKHPYKLPDEEKIKKEAKKSKVPLGSAMIVPATVFALDLTAERGDEDRFYERIGSGLVTGFAAHTLGPKIKEVIKDFSWKPEDFERIKNYDKTLATIGGATAGGVAAFRLFQQYAFPKQNDK